MSGDDLEEPLEAFAALLDNLVSEAAIGRSGYSLQDQPQVRRLDRETKKRKETGDRRLTFR